MRTETSKKKVKNDLLLIFGLLAIAGLVLFLQSIFKQTGASVSVTHNGNRIASYSLTEERQIPIQTDEGYNLLVIADHKAYIKEADCPDRLCVSSRPISRRGESLICLPHKLVILVENGESRAVDAEVY